MREESSHLSARLNAPRITLISSFGISGRSCSFSSSVPSIASLRIAFRASRSSNRSEQIRSTREDTVSAIARYRSMSWRPVAKVSKVGARLLVIRERRADTVEGGIGGKVVDGSCRDCESVRCWMGPDRIDARIACCEGSNREGSISSGSDGRAGIFDADSGCDGWGECSSLGGCFCGFIEGIEGGRRSAFNSCFSFCNLRPVYQKTIPAPNKDTYLWICSSSSLILSVF